MLRYITLRFTLPIVLAATLLPAAPPAQSQDSQSVAEAARRAREQKKAPAKPAKVITEDDVKPAVQPGATTPGSTEASAGSSTSASSTANAVSAPAANSSPATDAKDQKDSKELVDLKALIKQVQADLDLLQREQSLENDRYYSNTDYAHDTAGKAILDELKRQVGD